MPAVNVENYVFQATEDDGSFLFFLFQDKTAPI
jgi:hypothetical protein